MDTAIPDKRWLIRGLVTLATPDLERLTQFYQHLLHQAPITYVPGRYAEFQLPGLTLGLFPPASHSEAEFAGSGQARASLCLEVTELGAAIAHLTHLGYPPPGPILTASHGQEIYATDPDGNRLILHQAGQRRL